MSKLIHNSHKQVISLISPRIMTNINMLSLNNQQQKDSNDNNNINKMKSISNSKDVGSISNANPASMKGKHLRRAVSTEFKKPSQIRNEVKDSNNNQMIISPNNENNTNNLLTISSQLMSSKKCVFVYIFLIITSVFTFIYSIIDLFYSLNKIPLIACEIMLCVVMTSDMIIRIVLLGWRIFIRKILNWFDLILILFGIGSIIIYACLDQRLGISLDGSFLIVIILRNCFMLFRIGILYKNEKEIAKRKNVEEIIAFDLPNNDDFTYRQQKKSNNKQRPNRQLMKKAKDGVAYYNMNEGKIKEEEEKRNHHTQENSMPDEL